MNHMAVPQCTQCRQLGVNTPTYDLEGGDYCPICYNPTCKNHLTTVRFRWKETRQLDAVLICRNCKNSYQHRYWDSARREWIS